MFVKPLPSPLIIPPNVMDSDTLSEPLSDDITPPLPVELNTLNSPSGDTDAVIEPVEIRSVSNARFAIEIFVNPLPSPSNIPPPPTMILPDVLSEPVNCEPLRGAVTINVSPLVTDAVAEPLAIRGEDSA